MSQTSVSRSVSSCTSPRNNHQISESDVSQASAAALLHNNSQIIPHSRPPMRRRGQCTASSHIPGCSHNLLEDDTKGPVSIFTPTPPPPSPTIPSTPSTVYNTPRLLPLTLAPPQSCDLCEGQPVHTLTCCGKHLCMECIRGICMGTQTCPFCRRASVFFLAWARSIEPGIRVQAVPFAHRMNEEARMDWLNNPMNSPMMPAVIVPQPTGPIRRQLNPGGGIIEFFDRRTLSTEFEDWTFPYLDFVGVWNNTRIIPGIEADVEPFVSHSGFHFDSRTVTVSLPVTLVDELAVFWSHRVRDSRMREFALSVARCRRIVSELAITANQQYNAVTYGPVIAYMHYCDQQQNVSRVLYQAHYGTGSMRASYRKLVDSLASFKRYISLYWENRWYIHKAIALVGLGVYVAYRVLRLLPYKNTFKLVFKFLRFLIKYAFADLWALSMEMRNALMHALNGNIKRIMHRISRVLPPVHLKPGASMQYVGAQRTNRDREYVSGFTSMMAFDTEEYAPVAFASNLHNEEQAVQARVLALTTQPTNELLTCLRWCLVNHNLLFKKMKSIQSVTFENYIERSNASPHVKTILVNTKHKLEREGIDETSNIPNSLLKLWTTRSAFIKIEGNLYRSPLELVEKAPRLIQGAPPEFICLVGPWIMAVQDLLKRRWNTKNLLTFTSGMSSEEMAKHITTFEGEILEDDLSKYDSSISEDWCKYEVKICKKFGAPRAVLQLMYTNIKTRGRTSHGLKYKCKGTRKSGDPYTSLMNSIINGVAHLYLYCKWTGRTVETAKNSFRALLQGDDDLLRHSERRRFDWKTGMAELGFESKAIYRDCYETAEFCSNRLYLTHDGWVFGPKPGRVLAKLGYITDAPPNVSQNSIMRGIALGLRKNCNFIPPLKVVIERILELTEGATAYYQRKFLEHSVKVKHLHESTIDVEYALYVQYYWDTEKQKGFTETVKNIKFGDKYNDPYSILLFDRDTSGKQLIF